jgi:hypothetical protein
MTPGPHPPAEKAAGAYSTLSNFCKQRMWAGRGVSGSIFGRAVHETSPTYTSPFELTASPCGGKKFPQLRSSRRLAETTYQLACVVDAADARPKLGDVPTDRGGRAHLAFLERPVIGQFRPIGIDPVLELAASDDHRNIPPRDCRGLPPV